MTYLTVFIMCMGKRNEQLVDKKNQKKSWFSDN